MSTNFDVATGLPPCFTAAQLNDTLSTLEPRPELVNAPGLQILNKKITAGDGAPYFRKYTKTFANLSSAANTNDIELFSLPPMGVIHAMCMKHTTAFTGGAISIYDLSVGIATDLDKYLWDSHVHVVPSLSVINFLWAPLWAYKYPPMGPAPATYSQAYAESVKLWADNLFAGNLSPWDSSGGIESTTAATSIRIKATSTGANLNAATAGSVDVFVLYSILI